MCYMCWLRFLCSCYRLVYHCFARHPCALVPWWDAVLALLSITLRLPMPYARCAGGYMCCSGRSSFARALSGSAMPRWWQQPQSSVSWMLYLQHMSISGTFISACPLWVFLYRWFYVFIMTGDNCVIIVQTRGKVSSDPTWWLWFVASLSDFNFQNNKPSKLSLLLCRCMIKQAKDADALHGFSCYHHYYPRPNQVNYVLWSNSLPFTLHSESHITKGDGGWVGGQKERNGERA